MFFVVSKILCYLVYPLSFVFFLMFIFWILSIRGKKPAWKLFGVAILIWWFCSTPMGADLLLWPLESPFENVPPPQQADIIFMLGGVLDLPRSEPERLEFEASADRFVQALHLARRFPNALLVFSGGSSDLFDQTKREASFLKAEAMAWGIPEKQIYVEDRARNTYENAVEAKRILEERGGGHLVAVTTACHLRRALGCMRKVGIEAIPYPVDFRSHPRYWRPFDIIPQVEELESSTLAIREYVGILMYRLQGYL